MKRFKISILMILFVMILAVSAVSAADIDDSSHADILAVDDAVEEIAEVDDVDEIQTTTDTEAVAADGDAGNFTDLQTEINKDVSQITLEKDYTRVAEESDIVIDKNFTIDGQGKYTINANNLGGIFKVNEGQTLTLKGLTLINSKADYGGAVHNSGTLIVENCKFLENVATYRGGAIFSTGEATVIGSIFDGNDNTYRTANADNGGAAIYNQDGTLTVRNSEFKNNLKNLVLRGTDGKDGDLINAIITSSGAAYIYDSNFTDNNGCYGGAICALPVTANSDTSITVDNCRFINNTAYCGGAIYIGWGKVNFTVTNCYFEKNLATGMGSTGYTAAGGALLIINNPAKGDVEGCTFVSNCAKDGATPSGSAISIEDTDVDISKCVFENNYASANGAAIEISGSKSSAVTITDCNFTNNTAENKGGAIYSDNSVELSITGCEFVNNTAANGTVYNNGALTVSKNKFDNKKGIISVTPVTKSGSNVTINPVANVTYGSPVEITYDIDNETEVDISVTDVNNPENNIKFNTTDKKITVLDVLPVGTYIVSVHNGESDNYDESKGELTFYVVKAQSKVTIDPIADATFGAPVVVTYTVDNETDLEFTVTDKDGGDVPCTIVEGKGNVTVSDLAAGAYTITIKNVENANITGSKDNKTFNILKTGSNVIINPIADVNYSENAEITFKVENETQLIINVTNKDGKVVPYTLKNGTIIVSGLAVGTYNITIKNNETADVVGSEDSATFNVVKAPSNVTIHPVGDIPYVEKTATITFDVKYETELTINVTKNGTAVDFTKDGNNIIISNLTYGDYTVVIKNAGNENVTGSEANVTFSVVKAPSNITINASDVVYPQNTATVTYTVNYETNITINVTDKDGKEVKFTKEDGKIIISNLTYGTYTVTIKNNETADVIGSEASATFNVLRATSNITIEPVADVVYPDKNVTITYTVNFETNVTINVTDKDGKEVKFTKEDGKIIISNLTYGAYTVTIKNNETANVIGSEASVTFNVVKAPTNVTIDPVKDLTYPENNITITYNITNPTNVTITVTDQDGKDVNFAKADGQIILSNLTIGTYTVVIKNAETENYTASEAQVTFEVKRDSNLTITTGVNEYGIITADVTADKNASGNVTFILRNSTGHVVANVTKELENGTANFGELAQYPKDEYTLEVIYSGDGQFLPVTQTSNPVNITKNYVKYNETVDVSGNQAKITIHFSVGAQGNITIFFPSGANKTMPINGTVVIDEIFGNGKQTILVTYPGDDNYYGFYEYYIDFFVKSTSFISAKATSVVYQNNGKVTVTLTNNDDGKGNNPIAGATVTVTINGKKYTGVTNAKGIATIKVPAKLVPKTYKATVSYDGNATCIGDSATINFKVTKAKAKIVAKKKTFKAKKKTKKYTITLKDNKGKAIKKVKVTIKIGKKTFKAKTNKKGKATFKIKKLTKKGTYKAKITFKGNKYFKKVTKKVKIKVKK
ncbi:beta strand repeat-containing protein [Methanobrevibacter sp.]